MGPVKRFLRCAWSLGCPAPSCDGAGVSISFRCASVHALRYGRAEHGRGRHIFALVRVTGCVHGADSSAEGLSSFSHGVICNAASGPREGWIGVGSIFVCAEVCAWGMPWPVVPAHVQVWGIALCSWLVVRMGRAESKGFRPLSIVGGYMAPRSSRGMPRLVSG